jgi:hypothetical protein
MVPANPWRMFNDQSAQERAHDRGRDLPLSQDHFQNAVSLSWERMAIRPFRFGAVDSRPDSGTRPLVKERVR